MHRSGFREYYNPYTGYGVSNYSYSPYYSAPYYSPYNPSVGASITPLYVNGVRVR